MTGSIRSACASAHSARESITWLPLAAAPGVSGPGFLDVGAEGRGLDGVWAVGDVEQLNRPLAHAGDHLEKTSYDRGSIVPVVGFSHTTFNSVTRLAAGTGKPRH